jgi:rhodanese-related sulfurtransferase
LPEATLVFPAHDYKGDTVSTIGEEKAFNPRLQVRSADEYAAIMNALKLPNPTMMDVAVPENLKVGLRVTAQHRVPVVEVDALLADWPDHDFLLVDIREDGERRRSGTIPGSIHAPYGQFDHYCAKSGPLAGMARQGRIVLFCAVGERSTLAVEMAAEMGLNGLSHIPGGFTAWTGAGGPVEAVD